MTKNRNDYEPIKLDSRKQKSDDEMIILSKDYLNDMSSRHTVRDFSNKSVSFKVIENCIKVACLAPSGANHQPWHFTAISKPNIKKEIRLAAEKEENKFYNNLKNDEWLSAL